MRCAHDSLYDIRRPASASKCSAPTARWKRSAGVALVGFGGLAGMAVRQMARLSGRSLGAARPISTR
jgi:hypothetical protein